MNLRSHLDSLLGLHEPKPLCFLRLFSGNLLHCFLNGIIDSWRSQNKVFVWKVLHFSKNRGGCKQQQKTETWLSRNGKRVRSESRKPRKRRKTRGEKHKQWREEPEQSTRRHHEANVARASRASGLRVWWVACSPCSRAARARRAFGAGAFREFLERFGSELSGSIPGKAAKACEPQRQPVALLGRYAPSPAI